MKTKADKSNMRQIILDFPKQFRVGLEAAENIGLKSNFNKVIICGMGGSALPADILKTWLEEEKVGLSLTVHRDYNLPYWVNQKTLVVCISYSGNTEETLSAFKEAQKKNLKIVAITSGGKLSKLCQLYKVPFAKIPSGFPPRMALGFQFAALAKILVNSELLKNNLNNILALEKTLKPALLEEKGKKLAKKLKDKIPLIYASRKFKTLAWIWKIKFNENSKIPAFANYFPEISHNELVGFTKTSRFSFFVIILREPIDHSRILKRMKLFAEILKPRKIQVQFLEISGKDKLTKIFKNILLSDWVSYYLALKCQIDPTPVELTEEFKRKLGKK